ncbi:MAG: DUF2335 domain-containing protein [Hyphomonas sp.]|uniref:DUF2335 domain-containing protein n=1 Tax=Hyphomonas sp. TaxID=87 RepID=UPI001B1901E4|nr:DUF2335 domain-containing protein [Hyphomonas sp.]MBO6581425.1 DUF2335 domain-containing protein [Hyphomonas sp.]
MNKKPPSDNQSSPQNGEDSKDPPDNEHAVAEAIEEALERIEDAPEEIRGAIIAEITREIRESFSGPLPHPDHLHSYEQIHPGLADRIVRMTEMQIEHNIAIGQTQQKDDNGYRRRGMNFAIIAFLAVMALAAYCVFSGERVIAGIVFGGGLIWTVVAAFMRGDFDLSKSKKEKG